MKRIFFLLSILLSFSWAYAQLDAVNVTVTNGIENSSLKSIIEKNASEVLSAFNAAVIKGDKPKLDSKSFTKTAIKEVMDLWKTSAIVCPVSKIEEIVTTLPDGGYQIRNIAVTLFDAPEDQQEQELVLNFDANGAIDNVLIAMDNQRYVDIIGANISVTDFMRRQVIVDFVENFRTAYNRKDLKYLDAVFSDDALVISGKVIKVKPQKNLETGVVNNEKIVYTTQTKQQYLQNLKRCFAKNKFIDVKFDEIEVLRSPIKEAVYGVTLKQDWSSSTYSDTGYVFLMIDFSDELEPCIQVRTWQPESYNGKKIDRDEIFSLDSFNI